MEQPKRNRYFIQKTSANIDIDPISGTIRDFAPVEIELISGSD